MGMPPRDGGASQLSLLTPFSANFVCPSPDISAIFWFGSSFLSSLAFHLYFSFLPFFLGGGGGGGHFSFSLRSTTDPACCVPRLVSLEDGILVI